MRKSKKKWHYFSLTVIAKCRKWHLRGIYLPGGACPRPLCGDHEHGYTTPKTAFFKLTGVESLKLAFLKFNLKFNSVNHLTTNSSGTSSVAPGVEHFLLFPAPHGREFVAFCTLLKPTPTYILEWGIRVYFDWCIMLACIMKLNAINK